MGAAEVHARHRQPSSRTEAYDDTPTPEPLGLAPEPGRGAPQRRRGRARGRGRVRGRDRLPGPRRQHRRPARLGAGRRDGRCSASATWPRWSTPGPRCWSPTTQGSGCGSAATGAGCRGARSSNVEHRPRRGPAARRPPGLVVHNPGAADRGARPRRPSAVPRSPGGCTARRSRYRSPLSTRGDRCRRRPHRRARPASRATPARSSRSRPSRSRPRRAGRRAPPRSRGRAAGGPARVRAPELAPARPAAAIAR